MVSPHLHPKVRRRLVIILIAVGVVYALASAVLGNQHLVAAAHSAVASIHRLCVQVKIADPSEPWFYPSGQPRLFYSQSGTNMWKFYRAYSGARDPNTGLEMLPVSALLRQQWEAERRRELAAETAKEEQAARLALEAQRQQLQNVQDSLRAEKTARLHDQEAYIRHLLKQVEDKSAELTAVETNLADLPLLAVSAAHHKLAVVKATLSDSLTNDAPFGVTASQDEVQAAMSDVEQAETAIQTARAAQEKAKLAALAAAAAKSALEEKERQDAAGLNKLQDERRQSELAAQNAAAKSQSSQPDPVPAQGNQTPTERRVERKIWAGSGFNAGIRRTFSGGSINIATSNCRWWVLGNDGLAYLVSANTLCVWIETGQVRSGTRIAREGDPFWGRLTVDYPNY